MTSTTGIENRRHVRWPIDLKYLLIIEDQEFSGNLGNISLSGAFLETMTPLPTESLVTKTGVLKIKGTNDWVSVKCNVIYSEAHNPIFPEGAGVAFCEDDKDSGSAIWNVVMEYLGKD